MSENGSGNNGSENETDDLGPAFIERHGRIYHSNPTAPYPLPSDPPENQRVDEQHEILKVIVGGNYVGPIHDVLTPDPDRRKVVVDIGAGMGQWCFEMAQLFPHVDFYGIDIVPIAPRQDLPPNVHFRLHDINQPTEFPDRSVDVVHARAASMTVADFRIIIREAARILVQGGMFLSGEWGRFPAFHPDIHDVAPTHDVPNLTRFFDVLNESLQNLRGIRPIARVIPQMVYDSHSFGDITTRPFYVPIGTWLGDEILQEIGRSFRRCIKRYMESCRGIFLEAGYRNEDINDLCTHAFHDVRNTPGLVSIYYTTYAPRL
ncbi:S-adenosyl-L-methionine-dependent methyltransferase [Marasmius fiardii PR-910]|nr:S-adenosyl-L-methionine-dependent methyltransferase [Marasmius fiardii PR-910]